MNAEVNLNAHKRRIMLALDVDSREKAEEWVHRLKVHVGCFKVGLQLFTKEGPELVRSIRARGGRVFLDLKFHDIPNTVAKACASATALGVDYVTAHALGGKAMLKAAAQALDETSRRMRVPRPRLLAVTVLTSHDARALRSEVGLRGSPAGEVARLAAQAKAAGCDGVVCSPLEAALVRKACGPGFLIVTPGVRPAGADLGDQKRTLGPGQAVAAGADFIVVGRPVTESREPAAVVDAMARDMEEWARKAAAGRAKAPAARRGRAAKGGKP